MISKAEHQQIEDTPAVSQQQLRPVDSRLVNIDRLAQEIARAMGFTKAEFALKAVSLTNAIVERCNKGEFQLYCEDWPYPFALGGLEAVHGDLRIKVADADTLRTFYLGQSDDLAQTREIAETAEGKQARLLEMLEKEEGIKKRGALTRLAKTLGTDRANLGKKIKKARKKREEDKRAGQWVSTLIKDGTRQR